ncbi:protein-glutamate O-methyltransferase CheR [Neorhizobium galegae]|uniref:CheR family methyltransferase n=1 Tax=Neorhizobium galegae TaxID=399 RepID=UPI000627F5A5|nr:CheR family methyltransferase [Neorhizobium galegae]KAA9385416.1 chemotaxis protein CheR [Neorhizobium galegae]KAB1113115.1 chemotaxis protein CheR [Neorhizobium galegae]MCM2499368.1 chemotaxis protein CheR [Neorhizobium galegae]MCQ1773935.1 chemotaxis protein CheR [Neorhizobium galegae]MCQ1776633.1 chemotaxis protein CheR [Neorhizobium galegae]
MRVSAAMRSQPLDDRLSKRNFDLLSKYIYDYSGIKMPHSKLTMLEGRLRRRLRVTAMPTFDSYCDYLFKHGGIEAESIFLIDAVTTNKTDFFREPKHFDYMIQAALPDILKTYPDRRIRTWSSACSTGAEPYTMAMVLSEFLSSSTPERDYFVLATDLSTDVLQKAQRGIYQSDLLAPVPADMMSKYVMRSSDSRRQEVRISPKLRSRVGFARLNLMDNAYPIGDPMHMIFCRNVLIYFDKPTQQHVLSRLCEALLPGGYLFIGHSETVTGFDLPIRQVANTVFKRV